VHAIGLDLEEPVERLRVDGEPVRGVVVRRVRVVRAARLERDRVDLAFLQLLRPLEHHVFEEVGEAGGALGLVDRTHPVARHDRRDRQAVVLLHEDRHAVVQDAPLDAL